MYVKGDFSQQLVKGSREDRCRIVVLRLWARGLEVFRTGALCRRFPGRCTVQTSDDGGGDLLAPLLCFLTYQWLALTALEIECWETGVRTASDLEALSPKIRRRRSSPGASRKLQWRSRSAMLLGPCFH